MANRFYFSVCQVGAEKLVKAEVSAEYPQANSAFSRPGFVTFKDTDRDAPPLVIRRGIFTRLWGEALGRIDKPSELPQLLALVPPGSVLQAFDRDTYTPGDEPPQFVKNANIRAMLADYSGRQANGVPKLGDDVYSLIWVDDANVFLGRHTHTRFMSTAPGNSPDIALPPESPSRAYLKIEEAFNKFAPKLQRGLSVLEIGCAPGGATTAMLDRGLEVTGIDPQHMAAGVDGRAGFTAVRKAARFVVPDDLRGCDPDILVMDMSIPPRDAISELSHVIKILRGLHGTNLKLHRGFITLKLNSWSLVPEIPLYLRQLEHVGFSELHAMQLCSNRQEFFVYSNKFA